MMRLIWMSIVVVGFGLLIAQAHPADEFCTPDSGLDPELCRALAALDSPEAVSRNQSDIQALDSRSAGEAFLRYVQIGIAHILPGGLDHILFMCALVLSTPRRTSLLWQISAFTVAHTFTLALSAMNVIVPPSQWVEPLIAVTIAVAGLEAALSRQPPPWRLGVVFGFGLIHGFGFAGFFASLGLPDGQVLAALAGFNVGVEIGQLAVAAVFLCALLAIKRLHHPSHQDPGYDRVLRLPLGFMIAGIGLWWALERTIAGLVAA